MLEWPSTGEHGADAKANEMKEAAMAIEFNHPNIVRTLAYAVRPKKAGTDSRIQVRMGSSMLLGHAFGELIAGCG